MHTAQEGIHIWYCKHGQKPVAREVISYSVEATAVVLLDGHDVPIKLPSK